MDESLAAEMLAFAADRLPRLDELIAKLLPLVELALDADDITQALTDAAVFAWTESGATTNVEDFLNDIEPALEHTTGESDPERVATWLANATFGARAYYSAAPSSSKTWVTMLDDDVRDVHQEVHGTTIPVAETFDLDGVPSRYPGEPVGPLDRWINCRCQLMVRRRTAGAEMSETFSNNPSHTHTITLNGLPPYGNVNVVGGTMTAPMGIAPPDPDLEDDLSDLDWDEPLDMSDEEPMMWHSVLTVEGTESGDRRQFEPESLSWRELPLPLEWQERTAEGHDGAIVVGRMEGMHRFENKIRSWGYFTDSTEADRVIGLIGERTLRGISPTVDQHTASFDDETGMLSVAKGRICSGTIVNVPAYAEAYLALGPPPDEWGFGDTMTPPVEAMAADGSEFQDYRERSAETRKALADKGHALPDGSFPIVDLEDLRNAIQAIGRAKDPAEARRHIAKRARALGHPELIPDNWSAEGVETFARGRGWVTHPRATARLHRYWTKGPGAGKIGWGTPHDFYRCRRQLAKYISSPYLSRTCAQWHHDALGYWPGEHNGGRTEQFSHDGSECATIALVATAASSLRSPPRAWFGRQDVGQATKGATAIDVDPRTGQLFGYLATWGTCHIGIDGQCVQPPKSRTEYAYFHTGAVDTDEGEVPCGVLTMNTGHAPLDVGQYAALAHYDNTGLQVARVVAGEDEYGIWVAGQALPIGEGDYARFRASALSGDWRRIGGNLELVAALSVNVPGFPVARPALAASAGVTTALVAANPVLPSNGLDVNALAAAVVAKMREGDKRMERIRAMRAKVNGPRVAALMATVEG